MDSATFYLQFCYEMSVYTLDMGPRLGKRALTVQQTV